MPPALFLILIKPVRINYKALTVLWALVILVLTLLPSQNLPKTPDWTTISFDKAAHAGVFAVLMFLMTAAFVQQQKIRFLHKHPVWSALGFSILFGIGIELLQTVLGWGREGSLLDVVSNTIGCLFGIGAFYLGRQFRLLGLQKE
jgi:glycopeptide antibiotics resistance protein